MSADTAGDLRLHELLTLVHRSARAYCGPAHGTSWAVDMAAPPPRTVDLGVGAERTSYQLVQDPQTRRPARDQLGNYLYMPVRYPVDGAKDTD